MAILILRQNYTIAKNRFFRGTVITFIIPDMTTSYTVNIVCLLFPFFYFIRTIMLTIMSRSLSSFFVCHRFCTTCRRKWRDITNLGLKPGVGVRSAEALLVTLLNECVNRKWQHSGDKCGVRNEKCPRVAQGHSCWQRCSRAVVVTDTSPVTL